MRSSSRLTRARLPKQLGAAPEGAVDLAQGGLDGRDRVWSQRRAGLALGGDDLVVIVQPAGERGQRRARRSVTSSGLSLEARPVAVVEEGVAEGAHDRVVGLLGWIRTPRHLIENERRQRSRLPDTRIHPDRVRTYVLHETPAAEGLRARDDSGGEWPGRLRDCARDRNPAADGERLASRSRVPIPPTAGGGHFWVETGRADLVLLLARGIPRRRMHEVSSWWRSFARDQSRLGLPDDP